MKKLFILGVLIIGVGCSTLRGINKIDKEARKELRNEQIEEMKLLGKNIS